MTHVARRYAQVLHSKLNTLMQMEQQLKTVRGVPPR